MVGGFHPTKTVPENRQLAQDLLSANPKSFMATMTRTKRVSAVTRMQGGAVHLYPDREIFAVAEGDLPEQRFIHGDVYMTRGNYATDCALLGIITRTGGASDQSAYQRVSGEVRVGRDVPPEVRRQRLLLTDTLTNEGRVVALNTLYLEYKVMTHSLSRRYLTQENVGATQRLNQGLLRFAKEQGLTHITVEVAVGVDVETPLPKERADDIDNVETENLTINIEAWDPNSDVDLLKGKLIVRFTAVE